MVGQKLQWDDDDIVFLSLDSIYMGAYIYIYICQKYLLYAKSMDFICFIYTMYSIIQ